MDLTLPNTAAIETPRIQSSRDVTSAIQPCWRYGDISVSGPGLTVIGDVYNDGMLSQILNHDEVVKFGLCLGAAPQIDPAYFVGRAAEIDEIVHILQPGTTSTIQKRLVLGGIGGIGKTQLAIAYLQKHGHNYHSVFWLNATSQLTLHSDLRLVAARFLQASELEMLNDEQVLARVHEWLSKFWNTQWLLAFDNYDEPGQFDISKYCPYTAHGSIVVTSRLPDHVRLSCDQIRVQPLSDVQESLEILQKRSRRQNVKKDPSARLLAERLAGFPLALATAGTYLSKSASVTCQQYLDVYEQRWNVDPRRSLYLQEYQDRTLYTTWDLSYSLLTRDDADASQMLRLLAYLDNRSIRFELFHASATKGLSTWLQRTSSDEIEFESIMSTLVEYCFVEIQATSHSYSMHNCVHDWTLAVLNHALDPQLYSYVAACIAASIDPSIRDGLDFLKYVDLTSHAVRITHPRFLEGQLLQGIAGDRTSGILRIVMLLRAQFQLVAAEQILVEVLSRYQRSFGLQHLATLSATRDLAALYHEQGVYDKSEQLYIRVIDGRAKALGSDHLSTLDAVHKLANVYYSQDKFEEAERMYTRALVGRMKGLGHSDPETLITVGKLGRLYFRQGRLDDSEEMYLRAQTGMEKVLSAEHPALLRVNISFALLYRAQGKLEKAESLYLQLLPRYEAAYRDVPDHPHVIDLYNSIGCLYRNQDRLEEAEEMYRRALSGCQSRLGMEHPNTRRVMASLAVIHATRAEREERLLSL